MGHPIYRVVECEIIEDYTLRVGFDDGTFQTIDFQPVLAGELYGPLQDLSLFNQFEIDPEVHTLSGRMGQILTRQHYTIGRST